MSAFETFFTILNPALEERELVRLTLSKPRRKSDELRRLIIKPVMLKAGFRYNFQLQYLQRDESHNFKIDETRAKIHDLLSNHFLEANLFTGQHHFTLITNKKGNSRLNEVVLDTPLVADLQHERIKKRKINSAAAHWFDLGLIDKHGKLKAVMQHKFKQINKYIEMLEPMLKALNNKNFLRIVDMGAGKGYLTFALYEYLSSNSEIDFELIGVEQRRDIVDEVQAIVKKYGYKQLHFVEGSIADYQMVDPDVLIALHACDTATDDAIAAGILHNAALIVCAPCCHKQIRREMEAATQDFPVIQYGILLERQAEMITDTIRALIMEKYGYKSQIQEFIEAEHTPKNILLSGVKTNQIQNIAEIDEKIQKLKAQFGIRTHFLELALEKQKNKV